VPAGAPAGEEESWGHNQLLGHAETLQGEDPRSTAAWLHQDTTADDWCVLANFNDTDMSFGDGGGLAIMIRLEDLGTGRYDRLVTEVSMW
jgi:hypothetical protein